MGRYQFEHFPFEDPDIARALSRVLAVLLWNSAPQATPAPTSPVKRARQKRHSVQQQQATPNEVKEPDE